MLGLDNVLEGNPLGGFDVVIDELANKLVLVVHFDKVEVLDSLECPSCEICTTLDSDVANGKVHKTVTLDKLHDGLGVVGVHSCSVLRWDTCRMIFWGLSTTEIINFLSYCEKTTPWNSKEMSWESRLRRIPGYTPLTSWAPPPGTSKEMSWESRLWRIPGYPPLNTWAPLWECATLNKS